MKDAPKTHKLTLGKHSEQVTEQELAAIKTRTGRNFSEYEVTELQPKAPAELAPNKPAKDAPKDADKA